MSTALNQYEAPANVKEAASYLGTKPGCVRTWLSTGRFPQLNTIAIRLGRSVKFDWEDLAAFRQSLKGNGVSNEGDTAA